MDSARLFSPYFHAATSRLRFFTITSITMGKNVKKKRSRPHDLTTSGFPSTRRSPSPPQKSAPVCIFSLYHAKYPEEEHETAFDSSRAYMRE
ncbi:hypothetical protein ARMGADRAFT_118245 [Armillaria gallica]|uniref:Uncharacterized protein n=1 Tax=Armillaria gallica TaxID=47427 RepID=A0A2H3CU79_ARMGA|nr:hypothetical protein ARMGADRAFT_118245 [Armillaria gallica]